MGSDIHQPKEWNKFNSIAQSITANQEWLLQAEHQPRNFNVVADRIPDSQGPMQQLDDQSQSVPKTITITRSIIKLMDLTDQTTTQYYSWRPDPKAEVKDAF